MALGYLEVDGDLELSELTAVSPLDGRYGSKLKPLRSIFSEFGLIRHRVLVEVRWLQMLAKNSGIEEVPCFSERANNFLEDTLSNFGVADATLVKKVERTTNHDVKAIEYVLKDKFRSDPELSKVCSLLCSIVYVKSFWETSLLVEPQISARYILPSLFLVVA